MNVQPAAKIAPDLVWRLLDGSTVIVAPGSGAVRVLNEQGSAVWRMLAEHKSLEEIVAHLTAAYQVSNDVARSDVIAFLNTLSNQGILEQRILAVEE